MQCSVRHKRKLLKKEKERFVARLLGENVQSSENDAVNKNDVVLCETENSEVGNSSFAESSIPNNMQNINDDDDEIFKSELGQWQVLSRTSNKYMRDLLCILKRKGLNVPITPAALLKKVVIWPEIIDVQPGQYVHFGIANNLKKAAEIISHYDEIICDINIDGLPLFKSSNRQLWPILLKVVNIENISVFAAGIYSGKRKPEKVTEFLQAFIDECLFLQKNKLVLGEKAITFTVRSLICDAPAKAFVCGIAHHSSANGCSRCTQISVKKNNVLVYNSFIADIITDNDFMTRKYTKHHQISFLENITPFEKINLKMITQVPLDPMHLIDLGVTKKMLGRLIKNKVKEKISDEKKKTISKLMVSLKKNITNDFKRIPRAFDEYSHWKATEFRQFLLYTGILVLKNNVSDDFYYIFLLLHCSVRLLSCPKNFAKNINIAEELLKLVVENFSIVFGPESVSYNVHGLLHVGACVREMGVLYNFSAYPFENYLQIVKKNVRKPTQILEQLHIRNMHANIIIDAKTIGFKESKGEIYSYTNKEYTFTKKSPDNICLLIPYVPFKILGFRRNEDNEECIVGRRFKNIRPFFEEPVNSINALGICTVDNELENDDEIVKTSIIYSKLLPLPIDNNLLLIPILHGCVT